MKKPTGKLVGYARVFTDEQTIEAQHMELRSTGCETIIEEHGSGASRARLALAKLVQVINAGETLVVVRLDRLARSVSHLLDVIENLTAKGGISVRSVTLSIRQRRKACSRCRFLAPSPSWSAR